MIVVSLWVCSPVGHGAMLVPTVMVNSCGTVWYMYGCPQITYTKAMVNS